MSHLLITKAEELQRFVERLQDVPVIAFDTEFISEGRYLPELCLVQVAAGDLLALIDPLTLQNLDPFWELICDGSREILVHACRSEMEFCHRAVGRLPTKVFDVQLAAGFLGIDYPAGFRTLLDQLLGIDIPKAESRTIWNRRPLTLRQIEYALGDVRYLREMSIKIKARLDAKGRFAWYKEEIENLKNRLLHDFQNPRWRHLPKSSSLKPREWAIVREVWLWRDRMAQKWNLPAGRVLRDDLIVELARRGTSDPKRISAVRGFQRNDLAKYLPEISVAIDRALALPLEELPSISSRISYPQYTVMTQFLCAALGAVCKQNKISQQLVGGPGDVRELIAAKLGTLPKTLEPRLSTGWRAELIGSVLDDVLEGRTTIRLDRNRPEDPLIFG